MTAARSVTEQAPRVTPEDLEQNGNDQPYAILWLAGREIQLYEDEQGEFFTS